MKAEKPIKISIDLPVSKRELKVSDEQQQQLQAAFREALIHTFSGSLADVVKYSPITQKVR